MSFGKIVEDFIDPIRETIKGMRVVDLGCGDLEITKQVKELGAREITAIDKDPPPMWFRTNGVRFLKVSFERLATDTKGMKFDVAFISWPSNWEMKGLVPFISKIDYLIVLSKNTDGTSCGGPDLWGHLRMRPLVYAIPHRSNWLHIYGPGKVKNRALTGEEAAAIEQWVEGKNIPALETFEEFEKRTTAIPTYEQALTEPVYPEGKRKKTRTDREMDKLYKELEKLKEEIRLIKNPRVLWYSKGGNVARSGPYATQTEAINSMRLITREGDHRVFPDNMFVWFEEVP